MAAAAMHYGLVRVVLEWWKLLSGPRRGPRD
jgi:hypothetical protein